MDDCYCMMCDEPFYLEDTRKHVHMVCHDSTKVATNVKPTWARYEVPTTIKPEARVRLNPYD